MDIIEAINEITGHKGLNPRDPNIDRVALKPKECGMYGKANIVKTGGYFLDEIREEVNFVMGLPDDTSTDDLSDLILLAIGNRKDKSLIKLPKNEKDLDKLLDKIQTQEDVEKVIGKLRAFLENVIKRGNGGNKTI